MLWDDMIRGWEYATDETRAELLRSQRFLLSPKVVGVCQDLTHSISSISTWRYLFTPAICTFFEWREPIPENTDKCTSQRAFWLLAGEDASGNDSVKAGGGLFVRREDSQRINCRHFLYCFDRPDHVFAELDGTRINGDDPINRPLDFLLACLSMLNTRRLLTFSDVDLQKLNKRREQKREQPLLDYKTVELRLDEAIRSQGSDDGEAAGHHFRLHHVRSHLRIKRARVELVRPHWRGNAALGVVVKQRALTLGAAA